MKEIKLDRATFDAVYSALLNSGAKCERSIAGFPCVWVKAGGFRFRTEEEPVHSDFEALQKRVEELENKGRLYVAHDPASPSGEDVVPWEWVIQETIDMNYC